MPYRNDPIITNEVYHVFNRSVGGEHIFQNVKCYQRIVDLANFYRFENPDKRFSRYNKLPLDAKKDFIAELYLKEKIVDIFGFCIMPNHIHFLLKQLMDNGISTFMRKVENSYAKYYNTKFERKGALFQSMFKLALIEDDSQLVHALRYIHLNPLTSYVVKTPRDLVNYRWSSFPDYLGNKKNGFVETDFILSLYPNIKEFKEFAFDQVDHQRELGRLKHLSLD